MARIVFGLGTGHGPQLTLTPDQWDLRVDADRQNPKHWFRGKSYSFNQLVELRSGDRLAQFITDEAKRSHFARCGVALKALSDAYEMARADVAVIFGNDQLEVFSEANSPAFAVYRGNRIQNIAKTPEQLAKLPPGIAPAEISYCPLEGAEYAGHPELGTHIIESLIEEGFDVAQLAEFPIGPRGSRSVPHAYGFVYRGIMRDSVIPNVPIIVNTHYPPNRPRAGRCMELGRAVARAIGNWPAKVTVALFASGGLTHYVIDEQFDRMVLVAMRQGDLVKLSGIEEAMLESGGTAELKNWLPLFGAMMEAGLAMTLVDYVPCYRSEAGTGNAMAFAYWQ